MALTPRKVPTITGISTSLALPGAQVVITGTSFSAEAVVKFGAIQASATVEAGDRLTATVPSGAGTVGVTVTTAYGASSAKSFTFAAAPAPIVSNPITLVSGQFVENVTIAPSSYQDATIGVRGVGVFAPTLRNLTVKNCGYGVKIGSGAITSQIVMDGYTALNCREPLLLANVHGGAFRNLDLQAKKFDSNKFHGIYVERDCRDLVFRGLKIAGGSGYCLQLYYGSATTCTNLLFEDVILDARSGRYPLVVSNGFSKVTFRRVKLLMPAASDGVCVRLYSPTDILFEDFTAEGGLALVGTISGGNPQRVVFRDGTYKGPKLLQQSMPGVTFENVTKV